MGRLEGRTAIVTGGATGIGAVYAHAMAREGARVVIADIIDATPVIDEINATSPSFRALSLLTDVSDESSVERMVETSLNHVGRIDVLVNNAALFAPLLPARIEDIDVSLWDRVMAVNLRGPFLVVKHTIPSMKKNGYGKIINVSSGIAYKGMPCMLHYATSKGAMQAFTRSLSRELGTNGICVNTLAPGFILSNSIVENQLHVDLVKDQVMGSRALKREGYPEDLIGALIFLASAESDFVTGQTLVVDGGSVNS